MNCHQSFQNNRKFGCIILIFIAVLLCVPMSLQLSGYYNMLTIKNEYFNLNTNNNTMNNWNSKIIWILWFDGWNKDTPFIQRMCLKSWHYYNDANNWTIITLDFNNIPLYINRSYFEHYKYLQQHKAMKLAHLADIVRFKLLLKYGGVWVDSTLFCNKPLNQWLYHYFKKDVGFFAFRDNDHDKDWNSSIAVWFLAGVANSYILQKMHNGIQLWWKNNTKIYWRNYFWIRPIFKALYDDESDDYKFKKDWDAVPRAMADIPHFLIFQSKLNLLSAVTEEYKQHIDNKASPVYKINSRNRIYQNLHNIYNGSILEYLFNTIPIPLICTKNEAKSNSLNNTFIQDQTFCDDLR